MSRLLLGRLGSSPRDLEDIKEHAFFAGLDWERVLSKEVEVPFKPVVLNQEDVGNFEDNFTRQQVGLVKKSIEKNLC